MPGNQINSESKMDALEIEHEIIDAVRDAGSDGLSFKDGCDTLGIEYNRFSLLVNVLVLLGRFKIERGIKGNENRIFLPDQDPPPWATITSKQKEVLDLLCSIMDDENLAVLSYGQIRQRTKCRVPSFAIERLDYKGYLEIVDCGGPYANIYRMYPDRDGPRGHSNRSYR